MNSYLRSYLEVAGAMGAIGAIHAFFTLASAGVSPLTVLQGTAFAGGVWLVGGFVGAFVLEWTSVGIFLLGEQTRNVLARCRANKAAHSGA
jgi:hypothetical protein